MLKIVSLDIIDIVPSSSSICFVLKEPQPDGTSKISFFEFIISSQSIKAVSKDEYIALKFGKNAEMIAKQIENYVSCDVVRMWNDHTFVIYPNGEMGIFDDGGALSVTGKLSYRDTPARDCAADNNYIWSVVTPLNLIIRYSALQNRVVMRIGGDSSTTFSSPVSVVSYDDDLYVCNSGSNIIKKVNLKDYSVSDYKQFDEPVFKYLRVDKNEFVVLASGVYML